MRIVQLIDTLRVGGAERMAVNIASCYSNADHPNMLIVSRKAGVQLNHIHPKTEVEILNKKGTLDILAFAKLVRHARRFKPDIIHAHSTSVFWGVGLKFFLKNVKLVWHDHYGLSDQLRSGDRKAERRIINWIDGIIVVNDRLKNWAINEMNVSPEKVILISNFPYLELLKTKKRELAEPFIILQLANFRAQKNHKISLNALKILKDKYQVRAELWLAGSTAIDPSYTKEIFQELQELEITEEVKVWGEIEQVEKLLSEAHIGILSSDSEGLPVSLLEYGLGGLPVVVTNVGQCDKVLGHGLFGKLVPPGDSASMAKMIYEILKDYDKAVAMGQKFEQHVTNEYGSSKFLTTFERFTASI